MTEHLVKGEVVEDLDQFGVGHRQGGDVAGEKLVMVLARLLARLGAMVVLLVVMVVLLARPHYLLPVTGLWSLLYTLSVCTERLRRLTTQR